MNELFKNVAKIFLLVVQCTITIGGQKISYFLIKSPSCVPREKIICSALFFNTPFIPTERSLSQLVNSTGLN